MCSALPPPEGTRCPQFIRYGINGAAATIVHFSVLWLNLNALEMRSAGLANLGAAAIGITTSFLGCRYFVFRSHEERLFTQAARFGFLYGAIVALHGAVLYLWSDVARLDYRVGFTIALVLQVVLSYFGNKNLVFRGS